MKLQYPIISTNRVEQQFQFASTRDMLYLVANLVSEFTDSNAAAFLLSIQISCYAMLLCTLPNDGSVSEREEFRIFVDLKNRMKETIWATAVEDEARLKNVDVITGKNRLEHFQHPKFLMIEKHWNSGAVAGFLRCFWNASKHRNIKPENNKPLEANVDVFFNIHFNFQVKLKLRMWWENVYAYKTFWCYERAIDFPDHDKKKSERQIDWQV